MENPYSLRNETKFKSRKVRKVKYGTETALRNSRPKSDVGHQKTPLANFAESLCPAYRLPIKHDLVFTLSYFIVVVVIVVAVVVIS